MPLNVDKISTGSLSVNGAEIMPSYTYEIGQYVESEGGIIAHRWLSSLGLIQNYLVVDTNDLSSSVVWSNIDNIACNSISLWDGKSNSDLIITQLGATTGAAFLCNNSTNNNKNDWYLPSIEELKKIFYNYFDISKTIDSIVGATQLYQYSFYWSSTELDVNPEAVWSINTDGLIKSARNKNDVYYVRAVRKFMI